MSSKDGDSTEAQDRQVELWKVKKLIKSLQAARGYNYEFLDYFVGSNFIHFQKWYKYDFISNSSQRSSKYSSLIYIFVSKCIFSK
jgi:hypothetical protein